MYTVLIVEDEMLVSIGLRNMIDWPAMGMKVIAEAPNGEAALKIYEQEKPDIILTDIKMPVMDGLQLISKIRENDKRTKIIILTCYQEFDLLHQALKLGVSDYILKLKMSTDEIAKVIQKVHDELEIDNRSRIESNSGVSDLKYLKQKGIRDFLINQNLTPNEFEKIVPKLQINLKAGGLVICLMEVHYNQSGKIDEKHENLVIDTILNMVEDFFSKYKRGEIVYIGNRKYVLLFSFADVKSENDSRIILFKILERIKTIIKTYVNADVFFGVSNRRDGFSSLPTLFHEAESSMKQIFYAGHMGYVLYGDSANKNTYLSMVEDFRGYVADKNELDNTYKKEIMSGITELEGMYGTSDEGIKELFVRWIHWPTVNSAFFRENITRIALEYAGQIRGCVNFRLVVEVFKQYLVEILETSKNVRMVCREVSEAIAYIKRNYNKNITLQEVAAQVEISPNYLSSLFGRDMEVTFIDFVNQVRVDKAKELLLGTHLKTYEVAQQVGFSDESYFSRIFKRITGMRPIEYKRQNVVNLEGYLGKENKR